MKKTLTVTLYASELIYDIQNKTFLTGRSRRNGDNFEDVAHMQANDDEEVSNQILRSIGTAWSNLRTQLSEFVDEDGTTANNVLISQEDNIVITLLLPSNYNNGTRDAISANLHDFIVNYAIGEWFSITNKSDAADYISKCSANIINIRDAINRRVRPERPTVDNA